MPRTERFNRLSYFDVEAAISDRRSWCRPTPSSTRQTSAARWSLSTQNNRRQVADRSEQLRPADRLSRTTLSDKTVVRSAYGLYFMPSHVQAAGHSGSGGMMGFNSQSNMIVSLDSDRTPFRTIDNPFPEGFNLPPGNSQGAATFIGLNIGGGNGGVFTD